MNRIDCIIPAAGFSTRFGSPKALARLAGKPLIWYTSSSALRSECRSVTVVSSDSRISGIVHEGVRVVVNRHPEAGMSESIRVGLSSIPADSDGALIIPGDEPFIDSKIINSMIHLFLQDHERIVACSVDGEFVSPAIFPRCFFPELTSLSGDSGARKIIINRKDRCVGFVVDRWRIMDIDSPEALDLAEKIGMEKGFFSR